jgi:hypothetical protein
VFVAAALRLVASIAWAGDLQRDPDAYGGLASRLLDGQGFVAPDGRPTAYRPPFYPLLLAAVLPAGPVAIAVLQIALGTVTVVLTASIGRSVGLGRFALLAAGLVAVDPLLLRYTPQIMTEVTCAFLAASLLWLSAVVDGTAARSKIGESSKRQLASAFGVGVLFGLAVLSRPTFWVWGVFVAVMWAFHRTGCHLRWKASLTKAACVAVGVLLVVAPWGVRNLVVMGTPVLTTTHGGYTLLLSNNPVYWQEVVLAPSQRTWSGESLEAWQHSLEEEMARAGIAYDDELARDRWMKERAIEHIRSHTTLFMRSGLYRVSRLWDVMPAGAVSAAARLAVAPFYVLIEALALAGLCWWLVGVFRNHSDATKLTAAVLLLAAFTAVHFVYWSDARMRAPCVPAVSLFASLACSRVWKAGRGTHSTRV